MKKKFLQKTITNRKFRIGENMYMVPTKESPAPVVSTTFSAFSALTQIGLGSFREAIAAPLLPEIKEPWNY